MSDEHELGGGLVDIRGGKAWMDVSIDRYIVLLSHSTVAVYHL